MSEWGDGRTSRSVHGLMPHLVQEILLVSTEYDAFIIDEDGRFADRLISDFVALNLTSIPRVRLARTGREALAKLRVRDYQLVITMARLPDMSPPELGRHVKAINAGLPVVLLSYDSAAARAMERDPDWHNIDGVFIWKGDSKLLLAMIKLVEDRMNAPHDTDRNLVRVLIVVEDSPLYYSTFLGFLYTEILEQTRRLIADSVNHTDRLYRQRSRPKILLARSFEEACALYGQYKRYALGLITDLRIPCRGRLEAEGGLELIEHIRTQDPYLPILLQSSELDKQTWDSKLRVNGVSKGAPDLLQQLRVFVRHDCGFGDFVFRTPDGKPISRASNSHEMCAELETIPDASLLYHATWNHISRWLMARAEFALADEFAEKRISDFEDLGALRRYVVDSISVFHEQQQRGHILDFSRSARHLGRDFVRLGEGSLGGKGRGVAFIYKLLAKGPLHAKYPGVRLIVPRTVVLCSGWFDRFVREGELWERVGQETDDDVVAQAFLDTPLPPDLVDDLRGVLAQVTYPLAVRSSSLLEDSKFQPFAGVYSTYFVPNNHADVELRLAQLEQAIKLVYASTWSSDSRSYMSATGHSLDEESMAVLVQRVVGADFGERFYPTFSGVAQSYNYYPIRYIEPTDGIASVALGLGRTVVEGGKTLRFSPAHPQILPQLSTPQDALRNSQVNFYALALDDPEVELTRDECRTLVQVGLEVAEADGALVKVGSTYAAREDRVYDTIYRAGVRIVSFAPILKYDTFPLAPLLREILRVGEESMGCPVEIEFAVNLNVPDGERPEFAVVQIRPLVTTGVSVKRDIERVPVKDLVLRSERAMGNGIIDSLGDVVVIRPDRYDAAKTVEIAAEIAHVNAQLLHAGRACVLLGPGRWGTRERHLGVPVTWGQVSAARVIVELAMAGYDIDPSQGTHFFHNITSLRVGYLALDERRSAEMIDWEALCPGEPTLEMKYVQHYRLPAPLRALIDGGTRLAVITR